MARESPGRFLRKTAACTAARRGAAGDWPGLRAVDPRQSAAVSRPRGTGLSIRWPSRMTSASRAATHGRGARCVARALRLPRLSCGRTCPGGGTGRHQCGGDGGSRERLQHTGCPCRGFWDGRRSIGPRMTAGSMATGLHLSPQWRPSSPGPRASTPAGDSLRRQWALGSVEGLTDKYPCGTRLQPASCVRCSRRGPFPW